MSSFVRQTSFNVEYGSAKITKWYSSTTGLQLIHNNQPSSVVKGTFVVSTELKDDSGVSAALESLVFMGSDKYPYKGLIKKLEKRFFAETKSSAHTDHTRYEISTVGWESFKTLLPIFLEHLFHPTLTNEAFLTEVYHIDGRGEEMGKRYLQLEDIRPHSREYSSYHLRKNMFTAGSPYVFIADGVSCEIRELKNSQVRDFHKEVYLPSNICLIVTGSIDEDELLSIMSDIDTQLLPLAEYVQKRPFEDSQDLLLSGNISKTVEFPSQYTIAGVTAIGWIGPECSNHIDKVALDMVGSYLTECFETDLDDVSSVCYLTNNYVRKTLSFDYLSTGDLQQANQKLKSLLAQLADQGNNDLNKLTRIAREKEKRFQSESTWRQEMFVDFAIVDFLYGNPDGSTLSSWATYHENFAKLATWSVQQWSDLIRTYFVNNHSATIICVPSEKLEDKRNKAENTRLEGIKESYGENGLQELNETMRAVNEIPIPDDLLSSFGKPDPAKIVFSKSQSYAAGSNDGSMFDYEQSGVVADIMAQDQPKDFPLYLHFENITSPTMLVNLLISTTTLPPQLLKYSQLFRQIFSVSFTRLPSGEYAPCEETDSDSDADTISYSLVNSDYYRFGELLNVKFTFKHADYEESIKSLIKVFKNYVFEESRIQETIEDILECVQEEKSDHDLVMKSLQVCTLYSDASFRKASDWMNIEQFYSSLLQQIEDGGFSHIKKDLESIRNHLFNVSNMKVFVIGEVNSLTHPVSSWASFVKEFSSQSNTTSWSLTEAPAPFQYKSPIAEKCAKKAFLTTHPASCTEVRSLTPIPTDHLHEDSYKIALTCEFLKRCHCISVSCEFMNKSSEAGYLSLSFFAFSARLKWGKTKQTIADFASGKRPISETKIDNTIIHIVRELAAIKTEREHALNKIAYTILKKRGPDYLSQYLAKINTYTSRDLVYVIKKYFVGLFDSESPSCSRASKMEKLMTSPNSCPPKDMRCR